MKIYSDGGSKGNPGPSIALIYIDKDNYEINYKFLGKATNNQAEYTAFMMALQKAFELDHQSYELFVDSKLIVGHMDEGWKVNKNKALVTRARQMLKTLRRTKPVKLTWVPREKNKAGLEIEKISGEY